MDDQCRRPPSDCEQEMEEKDDDLSTLALTFGAELGRELGDDLDGLQMVAGELFMTNDLLKPTPRQRKDEGTTLPSCSSIDKHWLLTPI